MSIVKNQSHSRHTHTPNEKSITEPNSNKTTQRRRETKDGNSNNKKFTQVIILYLEELFQSLFLQLQTVYVCAPRYHIPYMRDENVHSECCL